ncbi:MAG: nucleotide sugar dehydrogenase [Thermoanaerobaculales bacterium]
MNDQAQPLLTKIQDRSATVGIIGLGYVGLPLALAFAEKGFHVLGFDVDPEKVDKINRGESYIKHLDADRLSRATGHAPDSEVSNNSKLKTQNSNPFSATTDFGRLAEPDAILICVPTPLGPHKEPDMRYVESSARAVAATLRPGQLVILESTTYPGTTDDLLKPILESPNTDDFEENSSDQSTKNCDGVLRIENSELRIPQLCCGTHFFLAFSPEREDPGNPSYGATNTPKVVGGVDETSGDLAQALYDQIVERTVRVSSACAAEATKLMENIFRAVNIALVNELKIIFDRMDIDIWEVLDAAETKPFGFMRFNPGPGWGGHCIPLDPFYLAWKARETGVPTKFIELAGEINTRMPEFVVEKLQLALNERGRALNGAKVLLLGLAYKKDIEDPRESPAFELIQRLLELGAEVAYHDPHIPTAPSMRSWPDLPPMTSRPLTRENLRAVDAVLVATDHTDVDYDLVLEHAPLIIDTRGVFRDRNNKVRQA